MNALERERCENTAVTLSQADNELEKSSIMKSETELRLASRRQEEAQVPNPGYSNMGRDKGTH